MFAIFRLHTTNDIKMAKSTNVKQDTKVPKEANLYQLHTGPQPIIQLQWEVVLPEASPLPLAPYTQQNRRRRSESVESQTSNVDSRSSERPVSFD
jgi:hypothetical protein